MTHRIAGHQARRGADWETLHAPLDLVGAIGRAAALGRPVLIDCLTLWLTNVMLAERDVAGECEALVAALAAVQGRSPWFRTR